MRQQLFSGSYLLVAGLLLGGCDALTGASSFSEERAKRAVAELLIDPASAQFRNVQSRAGKVCGEVNGRNKMGAYVGFTRFVADPAAGSAALDQSFEYSDLLEARELCNSMIANEYSSTSSTLSACERVTEVEVQQRLQDEFDREWGKACGGAPSKQVYRPELPDPPALPGSTQDDAAPLSVETAPDSSADVVQEDEVQGTSSDTASEGPAADEGSNVDSGEIALNWLQHGRQTKQITGTRRG